MSELLQQEDDKKAEIYRTVNAHHSKRPLCKDCRHITAAHGDGRLAEYRQGMIAYCLKERDLIDGHPVPCEYMRSQHGGCQAPGYLFEPRESEQSFKATDLPPECSDPDLSPSCPKCNASNTWRWSRHYQCCTCNHRWE